MQSALSHAEAVNGDHRKKGRKKAKGERTSKSKEGGILSVQGREGDTISQVRISLAPNKVQRKEDCGDI